MHLELGPAPPGPRLLPPDAARVASLRLHERPLRHVIRTLQAGCEVRRCQAHE
jgi:hypothetical protein